MGAVEAKPVLLGVFEAVVAMMPIAIAPLSDALVRRQITPLPGRQAAQ